MPNYKYRETICLLNGRREEIELEIFHYSGLYKVTATICQDAPPFLDAIAFGLNASSRKAAIQIALHNLRLEVEKQKAKQ